MAGSSSSSVTTFSSSAGEPTSSAGGSSSSETASSSSAAVTSSSVDSSSSAVVQSSSVDGSSSVLDVSSSSLASSSSVGGSSSSSSSSGAVNVMPQLVRLISNTFLLGGGESGEIEPLGVTVDPSHSILFMSFSPAPNTPDCATITGRLDASNATFARWQACDGQGETNVGYTVAEFNAGVTVQRGTAIFSELNDPATRTIVLNPPVDVSQSFILLSSAQDGSGFSANDLPAAHFNMNGTFTLDIAHAEDAWVDWQVVTINGARVFHQQASMDATTATAVGATVAVDPTRAWLVYHVTGAAQGAPLARHLVAGALGLGTGGVVVPQFTRELSGAGLTIYASVVELPVPFSTEHGTLRLTSATQQIDHQTHPTDRTVAVGGGMLRGGSSPGDLNNTARAAWVRLEPRTPVRVEVKRESGTPEMTLPWTLLRF